MRAQLDKVEGLEKLDLQLGPPMARFTFDPAKYSLQELAASVKKAGAKYEARLYVKTSGEAAAVTGAIGSVPGVRSAGIPDREGLRLITFEPDGKTYLADLVRAVEKAGGKLTNPEPKKN